MKIFTIWEADGLDMPCLMAAVDEYTIDEHNGLPDFYTKELKDGRRELVIEILDAQVRKLFQVPTVQGKILGEGTG